MMFRYFLVLIISIFGTFSVQIYALDNNRFDDPVLQERYTELVSELRCLVCQNENIVSSNAPLANDLRNLVYEKITQGQSDDEIIGFLIQRYGEFVTYRPQRNRKTLLLWSAPFLFLFAAILIFLMMLNKNQVISED